MKIILDSRKIEDYGIGTYIRNIFQGLINSKKFDCRIIHLKGTEYLNAPRDKFIESNFKNYNPLEQIEIPVKISGLKDFLYFSPHYIYPLLIKNRLIITIHDLIHFKFSDMFPAYKVKIASSFIKKIKNRAKIIFTGSKKTKEDLIEYFNFREDNIKVIHYAVSEDFFSMSKRISPIKAPYLLYIGNTKPHKNLKLVFKALSRIKNKYKNLKLVIIGSRDKNSIKKNIINYGIEDMVIVKGFLSVKELISYIDGSLFFVFPSLYEGFGLPPLEAMAREKAVLSSNAGSLKEVLGESALFFNPESLSEFINKLEEMINNKSLRQDYEKKSKEHSKKFKWKKSLKQYIIHLEHVFN